ncbi:MAG: hypothetical protein ABW110_22650 [Steroidobacteraceae bacterium]
MRSCYMKMVSPDGNELLFVEQIERSGSDLLLRVRVMGTMPMVVVLQPSEARKGLRLLNWRSWPFLLTLPFRRNKSPQQ